LNNSHDETFLTTENLHSEPLSNTGVALTVVGCTAIIVTTAAGW